MSSMYAGKWRSVGRKRSAAYVALLALLSALMVLVAPQGASATVGIDDYPSNLKTATQDSVVDPWGFYNRECVSFVAWRLNNDDGLAFSNNMGGGHFGNAYQWKDNAVALGYA